MKKIKFLGLAAALFSMAFSGCTKEGDVFDSNFAYLSESSAINGVAFEKVVLASKTNVQFDFSVSLIDYAVEDVVTTLNVDNAKLVAAYNTEKETNYLVIPQDKITFSGEGVSTNGTNVTVTVPAGKNNATVTVTVEKFAGMEIGEEYAVALKMAAVNGKAIQVAPDAWATLVFPIILLDMTQDELDLPGTPIPAGPYAMFAFANNDIDYTLSTNRWEAKFDGDLTLECWLFVPNFNGPLSGVAARNTHIFDNKKTATIDRVQAAVDGTVFQSNLVDEFFARFSNSNIDGTISDTEIKSCGGSGAFTQGWKSNEWTHLAIVFKRRDNVFVIYRNGEQASKISGYPEPLGTPTEGNPYDPTNTNPRDGKLMFLYLNMFGTHSGGFRGQASVRELRMWNVARRPSQIAKYMRYAVDTAEPNLVGYWPMSIETYDDTQTHTLPTETPPGVTNTNYPNTGFTGRHFANMSNWTATDDIPATPDMKVGTFRSYANTGTQSIRYGLLEWSTNVVNFAKTPITLKDGSIDTGQAATRAAIEEARLYGE